MNSKGTLAQLTPFLELRLKDARDLTVDARNF